MKREYWFILFALVVTLPGIFCRLASVGIFPPLSAVIFGVGIIGSAFILSWAAEVAQKDVSQNLALVFFALVAILPEYVVDLYFAWTASINPSYTSYALANMTGANRLLVGFGWSLIVIVLFLKFRRVGIVLEERRSLDIFWMSLFTIYGFFLAIKRSMNLVDTAVLFILFGFYIRQAARVGVQEPELVGPPAVIAELPSSLRRLATAIMFVFSGIAILALAEPFAESLVRSGEILGIDEFFLVQWVAPLASETPEFVVVLLLALRGLPSMALGALISSMVNQWSLLVGAVPLVYSLGHAVNHFSFVSTFPFDARQVSEVVMTAALSVMAVSMVVNFRFRFREALALMALFFVQLVGAIVLEENGYGALVSHFEYLMSAVFLLIAFVLFVRNRSYIPMLISKSLRLGSGLRAR